ncbi:hypothetical protein BDZ89DRAFT_376537 [Hymenopellis radicata]|nr:hypothetical protein BDZ89DRAFT_376537 [Hymenopellis radicata]
MSSFSMAVKPVNERPSYPIEEDAVDLTQTSHISGPSREPGAVDKDIVYYTSLSHKYLQRVSKTVRIMTSNTSREWPKMRHLRLAIDVMALSSHHFILDLHTAIEPLPGRPRPSSRHRIRLALSQRARLAPCWRDWCRLA